MQTVLPISANEITERLKNGAILIDIRQKDEYLRENITQASSFYSLSAFVGAGLIFAGVTGFCGMAKLLAKMPWNKV